MHASFFGVINHLYISGYYMYTRFNCKNPTSFPQNACVCFVEISDQTAIISL